MNTIITRTIDSLGRIVIPKEIRIKLRIKYGDTFNVLLDEDRIILRKANYVEDSLSIVGDVINIISELDNIMILVTDLDKVIYTNNDKIHKKIELDSELIKIITYGKEKEIKNITFFNKTANYLIHPIIVNGQVNGSVIIINDDDINETNRACLKIIIKMLIKQLEL